MTEQSTIGLSFSESTNIDDSVSAKHIHRVIRNCQKTICKTVFNQNLAYKTDDRKLLTVHLIKS